MRRRRFLLATTTIVSLFAAGASASEAGEICCALCGCRDGCQKVCRLVREEKKVDVICWGVECEDFCVPGPSKPGCKHDETICEHCDPQMQAGAPHSKPRPFVWRDWIPWKSPQIHTKRKLMQKIETKKIPSYKWVVDDLCKQCESKAESAAIAPGVDVPPVPRTDVKILLAREGSPEFLK